jgi:hypothetical protein
MPFTFNSDAQCPKCGSHSLHQPVQSVRHRTSHLRRLRVHHYSRRDHHDAQSQSEPSATALWARLPPKSQAAASAGRNRSFSLDVRERTPQHEAMLMSGLARQKLSIHAQTAWMSTPLSGLTPTTPQGRYQKGIRKPTTRLQLPPPLLETDE